MITTFVIQAVIVFLGAILAIIPVVISVSLHAFGLDFPVNITTLPFGVDALLSQAMGGFYSFVGLFPPLGIMFTGFMFVVGFKIALKFVAMIPIVRGMLYK